MSTGFERRVEKLRNHVLGQEAETPGIPDDNISLIQDIDVAHEQALKEDRIKSLEKLKVEALKNLAKEKGIEGYSKMKKDELISALAGD